MFPKKINKNNLFFSLVSGYGVTGKTAPCGDEKECSLLHTAGYSGCEATSVHKTLIIDVHGLESQNNEHKIFWLKLIC